MSPTARRRLYRPFRRVCIECLAQPALFQYRGRVRADRDHTLCFRCFRAAVERLRARRLIDRGSLSPRARCCARSAAAPSCGARCQSGSRSGDSASSARSARCAPQACTSSACVATNPHFERVTWAREREASCWTTGSINRCLETADRCKRGLAESGETGPGMLQPTGHNEAAVRTGTAGRASRRRSRERSGGTRLDACFFRVVCARGCTGLTVDSWPVCPAPPLPRRRPG